MITERTPIEQAEHLFQAANENSRHVRVVYLTFLLIVSYIAVTIASTTDEQLLMIGHIKLPVLNVAIPIKWFYALVPWALLLFHFNLILQVYFLSKELRALGSALDGLKAPMKKKDYLLKLFPFPFTHMLMGKYDGIVGVLLKFVVWSTMLFLPLTVFLGVQIRFLPYHSAPITWVQRLSLGADIVLIWIFWPKIMRKDRTAGKRFGIFRKMAIHLGLGVGHPPPDFWSSQRRLGRSLERG